MILCLSLRPPFELPAVWAGDDLVTVSVLVKVIRPGHGWMGVAISILINDHVIERNDVFSPHLFA